MALRVVSLPATDEQDEERGDLGVGQLLAVDLGVDESGRQVVGRVMAAVPAEIL